MDNSFNNDIYRSPKTLSNVVVGLFAAIVFCSAAYILASFLTIAAPGASLDTVDGETIPLGLVVIGLVSILDIIVRLATIVLFLVWLHRCYKNLPALEAGNLEFTPGWAVGWWFIPFANLFKPFQVMSELYDASEPDYDVEAHYLQASPGTPEIIVFWWAFFLIGNVASNVVNRLVDNNGNVSEYFPVGMIVASSFALAAAALAILIVRNITGRQDRRFAKISAKANFQPPAPDAYFGSTDA